MNGSEERSGVFGVPCRNTAPAFQVQKGIFHEMAYLVQTLVVRSLTGAIFLRGNHGLHALRLGLRKQSIAIIASIRQQIVCAQAVD